MISRILLSSLFLSLALGTRTPHERIESAPSGFTLNGPASPDKILSLRIALVQSNPQGLEEALYAVSTPSSPRYGQYLTREEAAQYVAPSAESVNAVNSWLAANGLNATTMTPAGDWMSLKVPVSQANDLFNAEFQVFTHASTGKQTIRTLEYSVPELSGHLDIVHPTVMFPTPSTVKPRVQISRKRAVARQDSSCDNSITPECLFSLYNIPTTPATQSSNGLGVTGYEGEWPEKADLTSFLETYRNDISSSTSYSLTTLDNGTDPQGSGDAGVEANLDIQYTVGLATGVPVNFFSVGSEDDFDFITLLVDTVNYLLTLESPPQTITTSYGADEPSVSLSMAINYCNAAAQLGARGVSFIFASGDGGVAGGHGAECSGTPFVPTFPGACPYLTSVGGTNGSNPETAVYFSSGGFSNYFATPSYQSAVVSSYQSQLGSTYQGLYNTSGRGFPDVSAQGNNFEVVIDGNAEPVSGTSCSSPTFASVISLINNRLVAAGKPALGFLNPWLYSTAASALNDITLGNNPGCNTTGFNATVGWDPVTGLGTPNFPALSAAAGL